MVVEERNFTIHEAQQADEAFTTSASAFVMPVVEIDGVALGDGTPGKVAPRAATCCLSIMQKMKCCNSSSICSSSSRRFLSVAAP